MKTANQQIIVAGYPKSGTTWAARLVAEILNAPLMGYWGFDGATMAVEGISRSSDYSVYQSHHLHSELSLHGQFHKVIYIIRDPRDIAVSGYYHFRFYPMWLHRLIEPVPIPTKYRGWPKTAAHFLTPRKLKLHRMTTMLIKGDAIIQNCNHDWSTHINSYLNAPTVNLLALRYEDMIEDGYKCASMILDHLGVARSEEEVLLALQKQSFENKRREFMQSRMRLQVRHMRRGRFGEWKDFLTEKEVQVIINALGPTMQKLGYQLTSDKVV